MGAEKTIKQAAGITNLWELPRSWCWSTIGETAHVVAGQSPPSDTYNECADGLPFFQGKAEFGSLHPTVRKWCTAPTKIARAGDILISVRAPVGPTNVADTRCGIGRGLAAVRANDHVEQRWLLHWLRYTEQTLAAKGTGTTFSAITGDVLRLHPTPLAPLAEQKRIVARIDVLFAEIDDGEAALVEARNGLDILRRALLKSAVTGELTKDWREANPSSETGRDLLARIRSERAANGQTRGRGKRTADATPLDTTALPELPGGWVWGTLGAIAIAGPANGYSPKKSTDGSGTLALKLTATTQGRIDLSTRAVKHLSETIPADSDLYLIPGDLLFQRGNTIEYVGIAAVYEGPSKTYVYPDLMIRVRLNPAIDTAWVWRVANSPYGRKYMSDRATGTAGTMPKISGEILRNFPVPIPPPAEATEILRRVSEALAASADTLAILDAEATDAARLKQAILKSAFEGRLVPQDPADEPAITLLARLKQDAPPTTAKPRGPIKKRTKASA